MTVKECYEKLQGDYEDIIGRFGREDLVERFMLKYRDDRSVELLHSSMDSGNIEEQFRAAHTLKGVSSNLAFTKLGEIAVRLTEQLRSRCNPADPAIAAELDRENNRILEILDEYARGNVT